MPEKKRNILIKSETAENLKDFGHMHESYDSLFNRLMDSHKKLQAIRLMLNAQQ